jgi:hypothetical protein
LIARWNRARAWTRRKVKPTFSPINPIAKKVWQSQPLFLKKSMENPWERGRLARMIRPLIA